MKLCPVCQRCYDDTDAVCPVDDAALLPSRHGSRMVADKYRLDRLLGRGGMGAVYQGTHVDLDRPVAIKLLLPDFIADQDALERFRREARAAARLNHPNVADTYDYGSLADGGAYIVMELIDGETLRAHMDASGPLPFAEAINIARQMASGVEAAHRSGITHRDLKPSNIILTRDHDGRMLAKVVDFSVAKLKEGTTSGAALTATGSLIGTPRYMAPEQCADNRADARSDIYSLGVILYEMIAGRAPFEGPTTTAIAIKHIQEPPAPVETLRPDTPELLSKLVMQALAKPPSERPQTAQEFIARLDEALAELSPSELKERPLMAASEMAKQPSLDRHTAQTNPQTSEVSPHTGRAGEPTLEEAAAGQEQSADPPSVQSYAVGVGASEDEVETKVSSKANVASAKTEGMIQASEAEHGRTVAPTESGFPLLSEHSKTVAADAQTFPSPELFNKESERAPRSNLLPYAIAAALLVIVGLGVFMLAYRRTGTQSTENNPAVSNESRDSAGKDTANRANSNGAGNQPALSDAGASPSPASSQAAPHDARAELQSLRDQWVNATIGRDINKVLSFYPPVLDTFYLKRNVPISAVRAEKERMIEQANSIELQTSEPQITLSNDGRTATMTFRKRWSFRGAQNSNGEVVQELRWAKMNGAWKITSERDLDVIR